MIYDVYYWFLVYHSYDTYNYGIIIALILHLCKTKNFQ